MTAAEMLALAPDSSPTKLPVGRSMLGAWFAELGFMRGAEVGVWEGGFAEKLCRPNPNLTLICVDPWASMPDYKEGKNDPARMENAYRVTRARLAPYPNCQFFRMLSLEAAAKIRDGSLDFVYLDGNHLFEHVIADLNAWVPKVKPGGIIAGHDYIARNRDKGFIQVQAAVDQYTSDHGIHPWFVMTGDKSASFAWVQR